MQRTKLALTALAAGTAACLAVMFALRRPAPAPPAPAPQLTRRADPPLGAGTGAAVSSAPPRPGAAPSPAGARADLLAELTRAAQVQEQALRDALLRIGEDDSIPLDARLDRYRAALEKARSESPSALLWKDPSMLAEIFLRMDGVQRALSALSPSARAGELAHIRRELGYDADAIARAEALDARHEARWQNGLAYMRERARVAATFEGDALESELRALREDYFADEAPTIEAEERDGFFRFERPRIYGRN